MWAEFKKFILRGNVIDLAIAVVLGAAFGAIVNGLVNDIIMPIIGWLTAGVDFSAFKIILSAADEVLGKPEVAITYGHLIQVILQFLIIAIVIFFIVKGINKFKKKEAEAPAKKPDDVILLEEIRDLLKK
ncbi:MAG TPA: large conductance mechanosensitive channel protein MscL [Clostridiales bacterium]|nr:large conductance mechanosensitive channel protein MscL [Clostridiales bacterium]